MRGDFDAQPTATQLRDWMRVIHVPLPPPLTPQMGVNTREQFANAERLDHIVVSADAKSLDLVGFALSSAEKQDRYVHLLAQLLTDREAIAPRQHNVEDDQIGTALACDSLSLRAFKGRKDYITFIFKGIPNKSDNVILIIDDQDDTS